MRYRKLDANGDYVIGAGEADFWINDPQGVAQSVITRLLLWEGEWFLDVTEGTPYTQEILGYGTQSLRDLAIQDRILGTVGVTGIENYSSTTDPETRSLTVSCSINTVYSTTAIPIPPVIL